MQDWNDENSFVVSGLMNEYYPIDETGTEQVPRVSSKLRFDTYADSAEWAKNKYYHVYQDLCNEKLGMWAYRVSKKLRQV